MKYKRRNLNEELKYGSSIWIQDPRYVIDIKIYLL